MQAELQGKIAIVTGATAGIGEITAQALAERGARVVLVSRSAEKCAAVAARIRKTTENPAVEFVAGDLSSLHAVDRVGKELAARFPAIHVLVNNAGGIFGERRLSADGYEMTLALNHLGYFHLTRLLLPALEAGAPARVVNVSSAAHMGGKIDFDDLQFERRGYSSFSAYSQSKLANILFSNELARRVDPDRVTSNALHPGFVATNFGHGNPGIMAWAVKALQVFAIKPQDGAATSIWLATAPEVTGITGKYFDKKRESKPASAAQDVATARRLWQISQELVTRALSSQTKDVQTGERVAVG